jgi:hypothetical protein
MKKMIQRTFDPIRADQALKDRTLNNLASASAQRTRRSGSRGLKRGLAVALSILLLSGVFTVAGLAMVSTTVAAIGLDINPSIELDVNPLSRVISAKAFNKEGESILATIDVANMPVKQAVGELVSAAAKAGYLAKDGSSTIAITTSTDIGPLKNSLVKQTEDATRQALDDTDSEATVAHESTGFALVTQARAMNIAPGRLNLLKKLVALDPTKNVVDLAENYKDAKASVIMKDVVALQKKLRNEEKDTAASSRESEKLARESEKAIAESIRASEKAAAESSRDSEKAAKASSRD